MSDSLSQNEIDALLGSVGGGQPPAPLEAVAEEAAATGTEVYDFRRPNRVSKDKLRSLEAIYERFAKSLESWLLARLRGGVNVRLESVEHLSFGEFARLLPTPCASYTYEIRETGGQQGLIDFGHEFAYFCVDRLFGGSGTPAVPGRTLTPIERMVVRVVAERVMGQLQEVWQDYISLDLQLVGFESIPEIMHLASPEDPVLVANVEVMAAETRSILQVCLPFAVLEDFFAVSTEERAARHGSPAEQESTRLVAEQSLRGSRTWISARLPGFALSMRDLLALSEGTVLPTGIAKTAELDVFVGTQRRFRATPGRLGPSLAVRLTGGLMSTPEADAIPLNRLPS